MLPTKDDTTVNRDGEQLSVPSDILPREVSLPWPKIFLGMALIATVAGALFATKSLSTINKNIAAAKEAQRPASVKVIKITASDCSDCFNLEDIVGIFKKQNVSIGEETVLSYDSSDAEALIKDLAIKRVPTYVVTGEVNKKSLEDFIKSNGEIKNDKFVFTKVPPVFIDPETKKEMGLVTVTLLTNHSCYQCLDLTLTVEVFKKAGIKIAGQKEIVWNSPAGQQIINQYKITKVPTFLLSSDIDLYDAVKTNWSQLGTIEQDKTYVARNLVLPYLDLEKGKIVGLVNLIYLTDSACPDCYKPKEVQKRILSQGYGVQLRFERTVDILSGEGQSLKRKYNITKIPTILLSLDVDQYANLKNVWKGVGTVESDGWYVFRELQQLGNVTYKDLSSNQIIRPAPAPSAASGGNQ